MTAPSPAGFHPQPLDRRTGAAVAQHTHRAMREEGAVSEMDHADAVADTGDAYTVTRRRPWHLSCLWCDFETSGHRTKTAAMDAMSEHYAAVTGISHWRVTS